MGAAAPKPLLAHSSRQQADGYSGNTNKKPDPEIYNLAFSQTGCVPLECILIEDSRNGVLAAHRAGMHIVATTNYFMAREDLSHTDIVVTRLGNPDNRKGELISGSEGLDYDGVLRTN
jgi:beta-phosphoglucomutase-like phosphatase (HAD superfamily)